MDRIQNSAIDDEVPEIPPLPLLSKSPSITKNTFEKIKKHKKFLSPSPIPYVNHRTESILNKYSKEANEQHIRSKRATRRDENRNTCSLYIQTDPLIWRHIREGFPEVSSFVQTLKIRGCIQLSKD